MSPMRLKPMVKAFLEWAELALAAGTVAAYEHQLKKFIKHVGNLDVSKLKPSHLTAWAKTWHEAQAVVRMLNWAVHEAKLIAANPYANVKLPAREERQRIMRPADMTRLIRSAQPSGRRFLLALRETYARPQEIRAACWDELQAEDPLQPIEQALREGRALIVLREYKDRKRRKQANKPRILLVSKRLGRLILRLQKGRKADPHIFLNSDNEAWTNNAVRCLMRRLRKRNGIQPDKHGETIVAYSFRHSMATLASSKGIKDRTLADLLGHVETRTTARYQHLDVIHLRDALERIRKESKEKDKKAG